MGTITEPLELVVTIKVSRIVQSVAQTESREVEAKTFLVNTSSSSSVIVPTLEDVGDFVASPSL